MGLDRPGSAAVLPRLECATSAAPELVVVAATERVLRPLAAVAATSGWHVRPVVIEGVTYRWYDHAGFAGGRVGVDGAYGLPYRSDDEVKQWSLDSEQEAAG